MQLAEQARSATYTFQPFSDERRIKVIPPSGFTLRTLPPAKTTQLGPATFTESYAADPKDPSGLVTLTLRFDSGNGNLTADQALAMRTAVLELEKREYIGIYFDQAGSKAFAAGRTREALDLDRALIAAHPSEPLNHVRLGRLLLDAGIGDAAHAETLRATQLDPKSWVAFDSYGWTLEHDQLGVRFGKGFDRSGAIAAHKQAVVLDPEQDDARFSLGIVYEFDDRGIRYAPDSDLPSAIAVYKELLDRNKDKDASALFQWQNNLMYALFYARQFAELDKMLATLPSGNGRAALAIASATAQHGAPAGIAQAEKGNVESTDRNKNLLAAGALLGQMRKYPESADLLQAGIGASEDAPATARRIATLRNIKLTLLDPLPATNPAAPVQLLALGHSTGSLTAPQIATALARQGYAADPALQKVQLDNDVQRMIDRSGFTRIVATHGPLTETELIDDDQGTTTYTSTGDDDIGYAVLSHSPGDDPDHFYVVREDGTYRLVDDDVTPRISNAPLGRAVLRALADGNLKRAKAMLDWKRDLLHRGEGDDPFDGQLLPRFWTVNSSKEGADSPAAMRLAAISLLAFSMDAKPYLAEIAAEREKATGQRQTDLDLLLARTALGAEQPAIALPAAQRLFEQEPDSLTALSLVTEAYMLKNDSGSLLNLLAPRLAKKPKDYNLLSTQARAYELAGDYVAARKSMRGVLDSGKATGEDYNSYSWLGLFDGELGDDTLKAAQQSTMLTKQSAFADLHTLACIYAAAGRTTEARQTLDQAMYAGDLPQPNSAVWYALGLIYEHDGATDAALAAYRKVEAHELDDHTFIDPTSTYILAQRRITALASAASTASTTN